MIDFAINSDKKVIDLVEEQQEKYNNRFNSE